MSPSPDFHSINYLQELSLLLRKMTRAFLVEKTVLIPSPMSVFCLNRGTSNS